MGMQATSKGSMPVILLKEGGTETKGRDAQKNNIAACKIIAEIVQTSLGPRGMDKMLVDSLGDVTITNDGATILKEIDVQHPAAKMLVEIAKTTDNEVGDGTTSAVVLAILVRIFLSFADIWSAILSRNCFAFFAAFL